MAQDSGQVLEQLGVVVEMTGQKKSRSYSYSYSYSYQSHVDLLVR